MNMDYITMIILGTFMASVVLTLVARRLAQKWQVVDEPRLERKIHTAAVPLLGGGAVIMAFILGIVAAWPELIGGYLLPKHLLGVLGGSLLILVGGVLDDKYDLRPTRQIIFPFLAVVLIITSGIGINYISNPLGEVWRLDSTQITIFYYHGLPYHFTLWADLFTLFWLMGMIYTTKFLDGLDGLVSGVGVIGSVIIFFLSISTRVGQPETAYLALIVAAAFAGFLLFNWHPAKIFLGEAGSLFAGFILGVLAIISGGKIATTLLIMGLPILDVAWVIGRRLFRERRSPFKGDRKHLHLRLVDIGFSQRQAVVLLWTITVLFGVSSLFLQSQDKLWALAAVGVVMLLLASVIVRRYKKK